MTDSKFAISYFVGAKRGFWINGNTRYLTREIAEETVRVQTFQERRHDLTSITQHVVEVKP